MGRLRFTFLFGLLAMAIVAETVHAKRSLTKSFVSCRGHGCVGDEDENEFLLDSETNRRQLQAQPRRMISYEALKADNIPCNRRGGSYYNCQARTPVNPYQRGCSVITHCQRFTS